MHHLIPLAAAQPSGPSVLEAMPYLAIMLMLMISLALIWGICVLTVFLVKTRTAAATKAAAPPAESSTAIPPATLAVIAAAANASIGEDHKIVSIKSQDTNWERAGRQAVITSHKIR